MHLLFCLALLLGGALAAAAGEATSTPAPIKVGEEVLVMSDGPGKNLRGGHSVACGKDLYLVVWREGWIGEGGRSRIFAARVSLDGKLIDPKGIEVAPGDGGPQDRPRVAFGGDSFLVVWQDFSNGKDMDVYGARVGLDGKVLDPKPIAIAVGPRTQALPEIASNGKDGYLVVWQGFQEQQKDDQCQAFAVSVGSGGAVGQPVVFDCTPKPKVVWSGTRYLAYGGPWGSGKPLHLQKLTADGKLDGGGWTRPGRPASGTTGGGQNWSVASRPGGGWLVVTDRAPPDHWGWGGPGAMRCYSLLEDGTLDKTMPDEGFAGGELKPNWLDVNQGHGAGNAWPFGQSAAVWDGRQCVVVWMRFHNEHTALVNGDVMASRVDGWKPLDAQNPIAVAATPAEEINPALASNGAGKMLCVYEKRTEDGNPRICARTLDSGQ